VLLTATGVASASIEEPAMNVTPTTLTTAGGVLTVSGDGCGNFDGGENYSQDGQVTVELYKAGDEGGTVYSHNVAEVAEDGTWSTQLTVNPGVLEAGAYSVEAICIYDYLLDAKPANALPSPGQNQGSVSYGKVGITVTAATTTTAAPTTTAPSTTTTEPGGAAPATAVPAQPTYTG
jgi:hypothetical protein